ncbi:helix-turn-helix domain-containing protein [Telmatocola sphagniphila]|uniref:Helix-turn-helix domain-containing protein n=1 Tax=Telmatocola sphagniphila TaxID=1123043 RepID=A0A8E6B6W7_9BACT|nr:helix-turn-helix domain-containing protein [Telmatocola sphagniphila]QVL33225.1 helix-turn-helix domain-containing protein [Telmatocola sphagniphila]
MANESEPKYVTAAEVAKQLKVSVIAVHRWMTHGKKGIVLPAIKPGRVWLTTQKWLDEWAKKVTPGMPMQFGSRTESYHAS